MKDTLLTGERIPVCGHTVQMCLNCCEYVGPLEHPNVPDRFRKYRVSPRCGAGPLYVRRDLHKGG